MAQNEVYRSMRGQSLDASKGEKNQHRWKYLIKQVHQIGACQNLQVGLNGHCRLKLFRTEPPVLGGFVLKLMVNGRSIKAFSHLKAIFSGTFRCKKDRLCYLSRKEQPSGGLEPKILLIGSILQDAFDGGIKRPREGNYETFSGGLRDLEQGIVRPSLGKSETHWA